MSTIPPFLLSASVFVCEHVLIERDGIFSAIRIVDVFYVSDVPPDTVPFVQAYSFVIIKSEPQHAEEHDLECAGGSQEDERRLSCLCALAA